MGDNGYSSLALKRQRQAAAARRKNGTPRRKNGTPRSLNGKRGTPRNLCCRKSGTPKSPRFSSSPKMPVTLSHLRSGPLGHLVSPGGRRCPETPGVATAPAHSVSEDSICGEVLESSPSPTGTERQMSTDDCSPARGVTPRCCTFYNRDGSVSPCRMCSAPATPRWTG